MMARMICSCGLPMIHEADCLSDDGVLSELYLCSAAPDCPGGITLEVDEPLIITDSDIMPRKDSRKQPVGSVIELRITISNDGVLID